MYRGIIIIYLVRYTDRRASSSRQQIDYWNWEHTRLDVQHHGTTAATRLMEVHREQAFCRISAPQKPRYCRCHRI